MLQYISDTNGRKKAVVIPINEWNVLKKKHNIEIEEKPKISPRKQEFIDGFKESMEEVQLHLAGKVKMQDAKSAILELENELKSKK